MIRYNLKGLRANKGISQKDMAAMIGVTQSAYSKKERNPDSFKPSELIKIAKEFDLTLDQLIKMFGL